MDWPDRSRDGGKRCAQIPFWYLMTLFAWQLYSLVVMHRICIGVYLCHQTAKDMGVHDHGSIVWDEFIGMWITLMALPTNDWHVGYRRVCDFPYSGYVEAVADPLV